LTWPPNFSIAQSLVWRVKPTDREKTRGIAAMAEQKIDGQSWALLALLSLIWGGSFMFVGIAVRELPALLIVFARVGLAALILIPVHLVVQGRLPRDLKSWVSCGGMSILNNVLPFTAIAWGQHYIGSGLASVINATTPMFAGLLMALFGMEALTLCKGLALGLGMIGVVILKGGNFGDFGAQSLGILAVTFGSCCYGLSTVWSKKRLVGIPPLTIATCQLTISGLIMAVLAISFSEPSLYFKASLTTWQALAAIAVISTAIAYLIFFHIVERAGPSFVALVTMLVPVSAILLGILVLGESLTANELAGTVIILLALVTIDGRVLRKFGLVAA
jgi:drug/metabolite transporter (DMT)-like permease